MLTLKQGKAKHWNRCIQISLEPTGLTRPPILDSLTICPCFSPQPTHPSSAELNPWPRQCRSGPRKPHRHYKTVLRIPCGGSLNTQMLSTTPPQYCHTSMAALIMWLQPNKSNCSPTRNPSSTRVCKSCSEPRILKSGQETREAYRRARADLHRGIKTVKQKCKQHIEDSFKENNPRTLWQCIRNITDYKQSHSNYAWRKVNDLNFNTTKT